jgi:hypothetical protein
MPVFDCPDSSDCESLQLSHSGGMVKMDLSFSRAHDVLVWYRTFYAHLFEPLSEDDLSR